MRLRRRPLLTGFDTTIVKAVIRKPFDIDELTNAIEAMARKG